ncbi:salivary glue protein Sgs-3 [Halyomorpha halys]|uniref:salivary glue protein Sgs-3 n=1 Tax=Halyomorpha halys TaxID=286706 RepID=UPI0006D5193C|nr:mucin-2-like [Halyomorpha halys]
MYRTITLSILLCFVTFHVGITNSLENTVDQKTDVASSVILPEPGQKTTPSPVTTPTPTTSPPTKPTPAPTTSNPTPSTPNTTTSQPPTPPPTTPTTTSSSTTINPTTPPTTPSPGPTNATTTESPHTTSAPLPPPSDRKFDAFSFLGGFALGLGLVAIGFLSWKFYLSRQENYYHTL